MALIKYKMNTSLTEDLLNTEGNRRMEKLIHGLFDVLTGKRGKAKRMLE